MLSVILFIIFAIVISILMVAGLTYLVCWGFGFTFTWPLAIGVWALIGLLSTIFKKGSK